MKIEVLLSYQVSLHLKMVCAHRLRSQLAAGVLEHLS
jgi:hypothetical protein